MLHIKLKLHHVQLVVEILLISGGKHFEETQCTNYRYPGLGEFFWNLLCTVANPTELFS
jgi:hypothetical protein